jgi:hypothetical protein
MCASTIFQWLRSLCERLGTCGPRLQLPCYGIVCHHTGCHSGPRRSPLDPPAAARARRWLCYACRARTTRRVAVICNHIGYICNQCWHIMRLLSVSKQPRTNELGYNLIQKPCYNVPARKCLCALDCQSTRYVCHAASGCTLSTTSPHSSPPQAPLCNANGSE